MLSDEESANFEHLVPGKLRAIAMRQACPASARSAKPDSATIACFPCLLCIIQSGPETPLSWPRAFAYWNLLESRTQAGSRSI